MNLEKILSISGKPGLYLLKVQTRTAPCGVSIPSERPAVHRDSMHEDSTHSVWSNSTNLTQTLRAVERVHTQSERS